ncbi:MAG: SDR family oxidoreductase [Chloroflexota bacterium]
MKYVVVTGVSTGIGKATAVSLTQAGYHVLGSVRKQEDAERLRSELGDTFTPLLFDVVDEVRIKTAVSQTKALIGDNSLTALVNNAGITVPGPLLHLPIADFRQQLEINVVGLLQVTQAFAPLLGATKNAPHPPGRIINISSVSGRIAYPFMGAYAASKHALEAMSDALRRELMLYGVDVILIQPGTVKTPIVEKFVAQIGRYRKTDYGDVLGKIESAAAERNENSLSVTAVTRIIHHALETPHPRTRYAIPRRYLTGWLLPRWLPDRWFDYLVARQLGF